MKSYNGYIILFDLKDKNQDIISSDCTIYIKINNKILEIVENKTIIFL